MYGSNPGLLHCRQILYHLSHQGSPYISICVYILYIHITYHSLPLIMLNCCFSLILVFYWSMADLQCVNFYCTAKWLSYTYTYILFYNLFYYDLSQDIKQHPVLYRRTLLSILYIIVCICWSQTPNPSLPLALGNPQVCYLCLWAFFCFINKFICVIF